MRRWIPAILLLFLVNSCHVGRYFIWNFADTNDYKKFQSRPVQKGEPTFHFIEAQGAPGLSLPDSVNNGSMQSLPFVEALKKSGTVAFLVIRNDSLLYENYLYGRDASSPHTSFSAAKSFVSALVGIAIAEGHIGSVHDKAIDYIPELNKSEFPDLTLEHLLDMRSGIEFNEGYGNPFGHVAKFYYGTNLKRFVSQLKAKQAPGQTWDYISVNTQLLALAVENATGQSIDQYLQEKIWRPLGMEYDATWSIDSKKNGTVKAFCCLNAKARDFAKFGRLYLNQGNWNGQQIVPAQWVDQSVNFESAKNGFRYSYQWWHTRNYAQLVDSAQLPPVYARLPQSSSRSQKETIVYPYPDFFAQGILGQFIYVHPANNMVIVRLGKRYGKVRWASLFRQIAEMN